jgi:anti-anti-sigma factor
MFTFSRVGGAVVATVSCAFLKERQAEVLKGYLADLVERHGGRVILDVGGIGQFSCAWINVLIGLTDRSREVGGEFMVVGFTREAKSMLRSTGLVKHLHLEPNTHAALRLMGQSSISPWRLAVSRLLAIPTPRGASAA